MEQVATRHIDISGFLKKPLENIQVFLKSDKTNQYFTWRLKFLLW